MMRESEPVSLHPFWDRAVRFLLKNPEHMRGLVRLCHPALSERLDFDRLEQVNRTFILDDYRQREADVVVRLPYRVDDGIREVIVYVLVEHQSTPDQWMAFRL